MRPYQSDLGENALLNDAILPAYRLSNGSRTSNSLPLKRFYHQFLEKRLKPGFFAKRKSPAIKRRYRAIKMVL
jgi:hypothetical protein